MAKNSANRAPRAARLRAISSSPAAVTATLTTRASPGSLHRSASPWLSSRETSWVMAGCDTFSWAASSVSRHGPSRDNRAKVNAAVELSSPGTASRRHMDTSRSRALASSTHSKPALLSEPPAVPASEPVPAAEPSAATFMGLMIIEKLYHALIYAAYAYSCPARHRPPGTFSAAGTWHPGSAGHESRLSRGHGHG